MKRTKRNGMINNHNNTLGVTQRDAILTRFVDTQRDVGPQNHPPPIGMRHMHRPQSSAINWIDRRLEGGWHYSIWSPLLAHCVQVRQLDLSTGWSSPLSARGPRCQTRNSVRRGLYQTPSSDRSFQCWSKNNVTWFKFMYKKKIDISNIHLNAIAP